MESLLEKYKSNLDVQKVKLVYLTNNMKVIQLTNSRPGTFSFFIVLLKMAVNRLWEAKGVLKAYFRITQMYMVSIQSVLFP